MRALRFLALSALLLAAVPPARSADDLTPGPIIGASWGATYGFPPALAPAFVDQARALGAGFTRVTLYWSQLEPRPGVERWTDLDAFVGQLRGPDEGIVTIASASPWATRKPTWVFPSSPAKDPESYYRFVRAVVHRAAHRVRYFQNDPEPNNPFFWEGSVDEFIAQQKIFHRAVKDEDPEAIVVLAGCDGLFDPSGKDPLPRQAEMLAFFSRVIAEAAGQYDVFDLRLYADPYTIPARVAAIRALIDGAGGRQPIIATEYAGPTFFEFRANRRHSAALNGPDSVEAVRDLAERDDLPVETRMFLVGANAEDRARLLRLQSRDLVVRNTLALASGIRKTAFWDLWHDASDPASANTLMYGAFRLMELNGGTPTGPTALGSAFGRMAARLRGTTRVERIAMPDQPDLFAFHLERAGRPPMLVVWRRPAAPIDEIAPTAAHLKWGEGAIAASTLDDASVSVTSRGGEIRIEVGSEPVFVEATS